MYRQEEEENLVKWGLLFVLCVLALCSTASARVIGDLVWYDNNGNGIQDEGEEGVGGVIVNAYDSDGNLLGSTVTATPENPRTTNLWACWQGVGTYTLYLGTNVPDKPFYLEFILPDDIGSAYTFTLQNQGGNDALDSDVDLTGKTSPVTWPGPGVYKICDFDAGIVKKTERCTGRIGDYVWFDTDRDGIQDSGENGINGVEVILTDSEGAQRTVTTFTGGPTQQPGYYLFEGLCAGDYVVEINPNTVPAGYIPSPVREGSDPSRDSDDPGGTAAQLPTDDSSDLTVDFGYLTPCTGRIGDYVWFDENRNGLQDSAEQGINGVEVVLVDASGALSMTATTFTGGPSTRPGYYLFDGLCAGEYAVAVNPTTVPPGYEPTGIHAGEDPTNDSDNPEGTVVILPYDDSRNLTIDFGYITPCTGRIGDYVWFDTNRNGIQDEAEQGINGVEVQLSNEAGQVRTVTTYTGGPVPGAERPGYYVFEGLCAGTYTVAVNPSTVPSGYEPTAIGAGADPDRDSNNPAGTVVTLPDDVSSDLTIDFGYTTLCTGQIGDYVWLDANGNGIQDDDEQGINGVEVQLADEAGVVVMTVTTYTGGPANLSGYYVFSGLCAGTYTVTVDPTTVPDGHEPTIIHAPGSTAANDSDDPAGTVVTLPNDDASNVTIDFGYVAECTDCSGGVIELTLRYLGRVDSMVEVYEGKSADSDKLLFQGLVSPGGEFTFRGIRSDFKMGSEISVWVDGSLTAKIHTSCSQPIGPGLVRGDFEVVGGYSKDGGRLCPVPDCLECKGGVTRLTLEYLGASEPSVIVYEGKDPKPEKVLFSNTVSPGEPFTFTGIRSDGTMSSEISVWVDGSLNTKIHTSCSQPIGPGLIRGDFGVVEGYSKDGGKLCPLPDCLECKGGVTRLTLGYLGAAPSMVVVYEGKDPKPEKVLFSDTVSPGDTFTFTGIRSDGTMSSEISVWVAGSLNTKIHTSCSQPIGPGLIRGDFGVVEGYSKDSGKLCPLSDSDCSECKGGVTSLTLGYLGGSTASVVVYEGKDPQPEKILFSDTVSPGEPFTFAGIRSDGTMSSEISVWVAGSLNTKIHTSCSQPIGPGMVRGDFEVIEGHSKDGGELCPMPNCGDCDGKVTQLTLRYDGPSTRPVVVFQKKQDDPVFADYVVPGGQFTFRGLDRDGTLGTEISVYVEVDGNLELHTKIHTSCSQPIGPGMVFGDFTVVGGYSLKGGALCTVGAQ